MRGFKYRYKRAIFGPPAKRHLNGVSLAGRWWPKIERWFGSFVILNGIGTSVDKKPYINVIFQGGGGGPPVARLDPRMPCKMLYLLSGMRFVILQTTLGSFPISRFWYLSHYSTKMPVSSASRPRRRASPFLSEPKCVARLT